MAVLHSTTADAFTPEDYGKLVDLVVREKSVASKSATTVTTNRHKINFPKWVSDPAVGWYGENAEISETSPNTDEVTVTPTKTAGLTRVSREMRDDSSPEIANLVGGGLANQIIRSLDAAYLGDTTSNGPDGLLSIGYTPVAAALTNLDSFISAIFAAEAAGSKLTSWIMRPAVAEQLSKLKTATGSNQNLIELVEDGIKLCGLPVLRSDQVDEDTLAWGIPEEHVVVVLRQGTEVVASAEAAFSHDSILIRGVARLGIGFLNEPGVVRLLNSPIEYNVSFGGASSGNAILSLNGKPTTGIAHNANSTTVKNAIVGIDDGFTADDVAVTGSAGEFNITVPGTLTGDFSSLVDATDPSVTVA